MRAWTKDDARASAGPARITPRPRGDPGDRGLSCARLPRHDPQSPPNAHVPNAIAETSSSALPSGTYRIAISSLRAVLAMKVPFSRVIISERRPPCSAHDAAEVV